MKDIENNQQTNVDSTLASLPFLMTIEHKHQHKIVCLSNIGQLGFLLFSETLTSLQGPNCLTVHFTSGIPVEPWAEPKIYA